MEQRISDMRNFAQARQYAQFRTFTIGDMRHEYRARGYNFSRRSAKIFKFMCDAESPLVFTGEKISFARTKKNVPFYFDSKCIKEEFNTKHGQSYDVFHNITPNYEILLTKGLNERLTFAKQQLRTCEESKKAFYEDVITALEAVLNLADRYADGEAEAGNTEVAAVLRRVPRLAASTFHEALQSVRIVSACFYLADCYQIGFGRMDQYFYPYYEKDIREGRLTRQDAYNLLAEFFVSLNKDTDLYRGVQQGDNGQSVMLGGCKKDGSSAINDLTYLIMEVSRDLKLIDPKINLRIDANTPDDLLELGCELTAVGLGFPQYSNDEVVIPALVQKGYDLEDARDYTVASCWEFIIPGKGMDVVNQGAISFPAAVDNALVSSLASNEFNMDTFREVIRSNIREQLKNLLTKRDIRILPSPFMSVFMDGALEAGVDASVSAKYHNVGIHGSGSANAADALAAIKTIFADKGIEGLKELERQKENNFCDESYYKKLHDDMPKVGNNDERADDELKFLFDSFADAADELSTDTRRIRPGSGSAMFYIWLTTPKSNDWLIEPVVGATADGKKEGEPLSASLAPSQGVKVNGVLSVLKSFSHIDYHRIMNGGPITIELTPSVFTSEDGLRKLAQLIKYFVKLGNQQLQLNVLDVATLEDAVKHPEKHRNLIVRVWGWSGYFCELAPEYQQHIIHRHKYCLN